jgi:phosphoglycolate phosphatase
MTRDLQAVLFDLDGTLANTLADLANATNWALAQLGCPTHPVEAYRLMVGDGAWQLCARALPPDKQSLADEAIGLMRLHYEAHCFDMTRLYPGIPELVTALSERGWKMAVLSNKPDDFTRRMIAHYFGGRRSVGAAVDIEHDGACPSTGPFHIIRGQLPNVPLKPDPTAALQIAQELGVPPPHWLYLGDTNTDMHTARAAGMCAVGVLWGFRDRDELEEAGAEHIVTKPADILTLL